MKNILISIVSCLILVSCSKSSTCETYMVVSEIEKYNDKVNRVKCHSYHEDNENIFRKIAGCEIFYIYLRNDRDVKVGDTIRFDVKRR